MKESKSNRCGYCEHYMPADSRVTHGACQILDSGEGRRVGIARLRRGQDPNTVWHRKCDVFLPAIRQRGFPVLEDY